MEAIDRKFQINAVCRAHHHLHGENDAVLFLAKDAALPATLRAYREECFRLGVDERQLKGIDLLIERVDRFQVENQSAVKLPDIDADKEEDYVNHPNQQS